MKKLLMMILLPSVLFLVSCQDSPSAGPAGDAARPAAPETPAPPPPPPPAPEAPMPAPPGQVAEPVDAQASMDAPSGGPATPDKDFLANQKFVLKTVNGMDYTGEMPPILEFGADFLVSGKVCNNFRGPGELRDGILTVRALVSTRMACPPGGLGQLESGLFKMLENGVSLSMDGTHLYLKQGENTWVFVADSAPR